MMVGHAAAVDAFILQVVKVGLKVVDQWNRLVIDDGILGCTHQPRPDVLAAFLQVGQHFPGCGLVLTAGADLHDLAAAVAVLGHKEAGSATNSDAAVFALNHLG